MCALKYVVSRLMTLYVGQKYFHTVMVMFYFHISATKMSEPVADIALIGLAVMGQNIILNMNDHGFVVCAYNRTTEKVDAFLNNEAKGTKIVGAHSLQEMVDKLKKPRYNI